VDTLARSLELLAHLDRSVETVKREYLTIHATTEALRIAVRGLVEDADMTARRRTDTRLTAPEIHRALEVYTHQNDAARALGVNQKTLARSMRRLGIPTARAVR
jgi:transcriptional regulator with GAF, ATPase, and Fis domain